MLAWVMNMGFAASPAGTQAPPPAGNAPEFMGLGDELWLCGLALIAVIGGIFR